MAKALPPTASPYKHAIARAFRAVPGIAEKVDLWLSLLDQFGLREAAITAVSGALMAAALWFWNHLPWYWIVIFALAVMALVTTIIRTMQVTRSRAPFDPARYQEFGKALIELSEEIFRFLSDRARDQSMTATKSVQANLDLPTTKRWTLEFQEDMANQEMTGRLFFERFGPRVMGSLGKLHSLGITIPVFIATVAHYRPSGVPQFFAMMGQLLSEGDLKSAIQLSKDASLMNKIAH